MTDFISIPKREWEGRCYLVAVTPDIDVEPGDWVVCTNIEALPPGWLRLIHGVTIRALESKRAGEVCKFAVPTRDPKPDHRPFDFTPAPDAKDLDYPRGTDWLYPKNAGTL